MRNSPLACSNAVPTSKLLIHGLNITLRYHGGRYSHAILDRTYYWGMVPQIRELCGMQREGAVGRKGVVRSRLSSGQSGVWPILPFPRLLGRLAVDQSPVGAFPRFRAISGESSGAVEAWAKCQWTPTASFRPYI